jgi:hypothetical protein
VVVQLELNVNAFVETEFLPHLRQAREAGVRFTTMADLGDTVDARRQLYLLTMSGSADITGCGRFYTFDDYLDQRIEVASYDPQGVILALHGRHWVGMAATSARADTAFSDMTGVLLASWRGSGLSVAMTVLAIRFLRSRGKDVLRSVHHPTELAAIATNRRLGFVDTRLSSPVDETGDRAALPMQF